MRELALGGVFLVLAGLSLSAEAGRRDYAARLLPSGDGDGGAHRGSCTPAVTQGPSWGALVHRSHCSRRPLTGDGDGYFAMFLWSMSARWGLSPPPLVPLFLLCVCSPLCGWALCGSRWRRSLKQITDPEEIGALVTGVLSANAKEVDLYRNVRWALLAHLMRGGGWGAQFGLWVEGEEKWYGWVRTARLDIAPPPVRPAPVRERCPPIRQKLTPLLWLAPRCLWHLE